MTPEEIRDLDSIASEMEQGFRQRGGWQACRYILGEMQRLNNKEVQRLREEQRDIARLLGCEDCENIETPSNIPNVIRDLQIKTKQLAEKLASQVTVEKRLSLYSTGVEAEVQRLRAKVKLLESDLTNTQKQAIDEMVDDMLF